MSYQTPLHGLSVDNDLLVLINDQALPETGIDPDTFWSGFAQIIRDLTSKNLALLERREALEAAIDEWHKKHRDEPHDPDAYRTFLGDIGYLAPEGPDFSATTSDVDDEITTIPGPQLVVPVNNARYAINAANARWGSLYDALYGTDAISDEAGVLTSGKYSAERGSRVVAFANNFLDQTAPFNGASYSEISGFIVERGELKAGSLIMP